MHVALHWGESNGAGERANAGGTLRKFNVIDAHVNEMNVSLSLRFRSLAIGEPGCPAPAGSGKTAQAAGVTLV
jgi:hypothetical protein